jgi:hypothetical protein
MLTSGAQAAAGGTPSLALDELTMLSEFLSEVAERFRQG